MRLEPRPRRGFAAILFLLLLPVLFGAAAVSIDRAVLLVRDGETQNAADAMAHAASRQLDGTAAGLTRAQAAATRVAQLNMIGQAPLSFSRLTGPRATLFLGRYENGSFVVDTTNPRMVTAAKAVALRRDVPTVFGNIAFSETELMTERGAVALAGGVGRVDCPLPIAVPSCLLPEPTGICNADLVFNADGNDNAGWARIGSSRPSGSSITDAITACGIPSAGTVDVVSLNNGEINTALKALADAASASPTVWNTTKYGAMPAQSTRSGVTRYGHVKEGYIIVFQDPQNCSGTKYTGTNLPIVGFAKASVYDVDTKGAASTRRVYTKLRCDIAQHAGTGGGYYGLTAPPRLVAGG